MKFISTILKKREIGNDFRKIEHLLTRHLEELKKKRAQIPADVFDTINFILEETLDLYKSIPRLHNKGHFQSCLLIGRSIIENCITLQYILRNDTERKARNFILHSIVSFADKLKKIKENVLWRDAMINHLEQLKKQIKKSGVRDYYWDGKSFKQICSELHLDSVYELWYGRLSNYVHSHYTDHRDFDTERPYNNFIKKLIFQDIPVLTLQTLKDINERFNLLEGGAIIENYPEKGTTFVFSISSKEADKKAMEQLSDKIKK